MKIGLNASGMLSHPNLDMIVKAAVAAEDDGFESFWLAQTALLDAQTTLAIAGRATSTIELGTAVVPIWPRHPHAMAASALTTQAASGGRFVLGIGLSHQPVVEGTYKMEWSRPIRHMTDHLDVLLPLLQDGESDHVGETASYVGSGARPTTEPPKVMLAALGDQMLRLAGERTDGTILWCVGPKAVEQQIAPKINAAASAAGREAPSIVCSLPVCVTDRPGEVKEFLAKSLAVYSQLPSYRAMLDIEGAEGIQDIALVGSASEVTDGLARVRESGATDFTAVITASTPEEIEATKAALLA